MGIVWFEWFEEEIEENSTLIKKVMDLVAFDGSHNDGSSAIDTEVEGGRQVCGVEGDLVLRNKMMAMKEKMKVIKNEKSM
ncbi:hypothetical protein PVK06_019546 [Gossypium arboreum]|uniref:Uncharacterized protein n=1 Tax=Gossypium arboreum TaxID=29729 RepID=A0ABR0PK23_GOSAR|nr:hypothetical protein PVK06_019546 [Gossypium arboreum]